MLCLFSGWDLRINTIRQCFDHLSKTKLFNFWAIHKMVPQQSLTFFISREFGEVSGGVGEVERVWNISAFQKIIIFA